MWINALKIWNGRSTELQVPHRDIWGIPRKNTPVYEEVKKIMKPEAEKPKMEMMEE